MAYRSTSATHLPYLQRFSKPNLHFPSPPHPQLPFLNPNSHRPFSLSTTPIPYALSPPSLLRPSSSSAASAPPIESLSTTTNNQSLTLRDLCEGHIPVHILRRVEEVGYVLPTEIQRQALPILFSGRDCVLHAQTGSGKTLAYLLSILSVVNAQRSAVQALIVVPTRELGMQVTQVARMLAANPEEHGLGQKSFTVMALLDGGSLRRHKSWLKADPPTILVATLWSLCLMLNKRIAKLESMKVLVIDELCGLQCGLIGFGGTEQDVGIEHAHVDFMFNSSNEVSSLKKLLTLYSSSSTRQTIFASASIPQHKRFVHDCIQQKWTKADVVHVHANPIQPMPSCLHHRFVICDKNGRHSALLSLLQADAPQSAIIFVGEQSEKSKKAGNDPPTTALIDALKSSNLGLPDILLLEEDLHYNSRAASLSELREGGAYLLVSTDIAARGVDLPDTTHIYNFDLPKDAVNYLHRAGRTCRKPFSDKKCTVTSILTSQERFVLQKFENELLFECEEL